MRMQVAQIAFPVKVLGPGKRIGLWLQGCLKRCPHCIATQFLPLKGGASYPVEAVRDEILFYARNFGASGVTISGGEPLLQWPALRLVLQQVKGTLTDFSSILFTGYKYTPSGKFHLLPSEQPADIENLVDLLIDDEYVDDLNDGAFMKGSTNQTMHFTNTQFREEFETYVQDQNSTRRFQKLTGADFVAGMPPRGFARQLSLTRS
jgi:anaerobic ribonucleoside-triphosphate reductase activating protein